MRVTGLSAIFGHGVNAQFADFSPGFPERMHSFCAAELGNGDALCTK
jgi:hypothetical protein